MVWVLQMCVVTIVSFCVSARVLFCNLSSTPLLWSGCTAVSLEHNHHTTTSATSQPQFGNLLRSRQHTRRVRQSMP